MYCVLYLGTVGHAVQYCRRPILCYNCTHTGTSTIVQYSSTSRAVLIKDTEYDLQSFLTDTKIMIHFTCVEILPGVTSSFHSQRMLRFAIKDPCI